MHCFVKFEFLINGILRGGNWKQNVKTTNWPFSIFSFWFSKYWSMMFNFTFLSNKHWKKKILRIKHWKSRLMWSFDFQFSILNENQMDENHMDLPLSSFLTAMILDISIGTPWFVMIFGTNTTSDIPKLLYVISRAVRRVKFRQFWNITTGCYAKYHVQIMLLFVYTTTHERFVIFTCRCFKLSWKTCGLSQSNCRNFSCSSIVAIISNITAVRKEEMDI